MKCCNEPLKKMMFIINRNCLWLLKPTKRALKKPKVNLLFPNTPGLPWKATTFFLFYFSEYFFTCFITLPPPIPLRFLLLCGPLPTFFFSSSLLLEITQTFIFCFLSSQGIFPPSLVLLDHTFCDVSSAEEQDICFCFSPLPLSSSGRAPLNLRNDLREK